MTDSVAISIVLPAFNEEALINRCLKTLTSQNFPKPYEIIVVDNNSIDKTVEIIKTFPSVKLIEEKLQGVIQARQRGLIAARGEIVISTDCDSQYPPNWLSNLYPLFNNPHVVAAGGPAIAEPNPWWAHLIYKWGYRFVGYIYRKFGKVIYLGGYNFAYRREVFLNSGGYKTYFDLGGGDEIEPLMRLKKYGKVVFSPDASMYVSLRRYREGFIRWFFVHHTYYYFLSLFLSLIFKKQFIHAKPVRNI